MDGTIERRMRTLERYCSIDGAEPADVPAIVASCSTAGGRFESTALPHPSSATARSPTGSSPSTRS